MARNKAPHPLLKEKPSVVHFGIQAVTQGIKTSGAKLIEADFTPPSRGNLERMRFLAELSSEKISPRIQQANQSAVEAFLAVQPHLIGVGTAKNVVPGMQPDLFLHAGPPIGWKDASGPLRGAIIGGLLWEGMAKTPAEAEKLARSGKIRLEPCHHHQTVGPMAGLVTSSMPVWIIEDQNRPGPSGRTYCTLNEGLGKVLRYGAFGKEVLLRLDFMKEVLGPILRETLEKRGPLDLRHIMAQALQMGDEGHNRNRAGTSLLFRELAATAVQLKRPSKDLAAVLDFIHQNDHFFLNLSMPMAKCMLQRAEGHAFGSMVTIMSRNGTEFGIQLASMPGKWFTGPAQPVNGLYFPGYGPKDANLDIGDSTIMETAGLGGFAMAAAPAIVQFVGGSVADAQRTSREMQTICLARNPTWTIPPFDFASCPVGIDLLKVMEQNRLPAINTGIAHKQPGIGQVGAGLVRPPWECFDQALDAFYKHCLEQPLLPKKRRTS